MTTTLLITNYEHVSIFYQTSPGKFDNAETFEFSGRASNLGSVVIVTDIDNDGDEDIVHYNMKL